MTSDNTTHNSPFDDSLARNLNNLPDAEVPEGLEDRVMATLFSESNQHTNETTTPKTVAHQRPLSPLKKMLPLVSIAASVLIILGGYQLFNTSTPSAPLPQVAQTTTNPTPAPSELPTPPKKLATTGVSSSVSENAEEIVETIFIASLSDPVDAFRNDSIETYLDTYENSEPDVITDFMGF